MGLDFHKFITQSANEASSELHHNFHAFYTFWRQEFAVTNLLGVSSFLLSRFPEIPSSTTSPSHFPFDTVPPPRPRLPSSISVPRPSPPAWASSLPMSPEFLSLIPDWASAQTHLASSPDDLGVSGVCGS